MQRHRLVDSISENAHKLLQDLCVEAGLSIENWESVDNQLWDDCSKIQHLYKGEMLNELELAELAAAGDVGALTLLRNAFYLPVFV